MTLKDDSWMEQAACRAFTMPRYRDWWFPDRPDVMPIKAREACASCPVLEQCKTNIMEQEGAKKTNGRFVNGNQAGMTPLERYRLYRTGGVEKYPSKRKSTRPNVVRKKNMVATPRLRSAPNQRQLKAKTKKHEMNRYVPPAGATWYSTGTRFVEFDKDGNPAIVKEKWRAHWLENGKNRYAVEYRFVDVG